MRKLYWGCAVAGLAALGVFKTADLARHHPETSLGRWVVGVYRAAANFSALCDAGMYLVHRTHEGAVDIEEVLDEVPEEPEPAGTGEPAPVESPEQCPDLPAAEHGQLPGKIVIEEGDELPKAADWRWRPGDLLAEALENGEYRLDRMEIELGSRAWAQSILDAQDVRPQPNLDRMVERLVTQQFIEDTRGNEFEPTYRLELRAMNLASAAEADRNSRESVEEESIRQMPYCDENSEPRAMPSPHEPAPAPRKQAPPRIWNPFPPKGTEVGEPELSPNGNDCREDTSTSLQIPGCVGTPRSDCTKETAGGEEESEPPPTEKKESKRAEPPPAKHLLDASKLLPFAAPVKVDTMEFRPTDWGKDDVPLPPI